MLDAALARNVFRQVMVKLLEPAGLGPASQKRAQKIQVRQPLCQLKTELRVFQVRLAWRAGSGQPAHGPVIRKRLVAEFGGRRGCVVVVEETHFGLQVILLPVQLHDFEAPQAAGQDVHAAIGVSFEHLFHHHRATGAHDAVFLCQNHPEFRVVAEGVSDHFLIPLFENVQRQAGPGKHHHL